MSKSKPNTDTLDRVANRRKVPPPTKVFRDKNKYTRKIKFVRCDD